MPSELFIDRYQLADPVFLASHNLLALHSLSGEQDLEAPDWVVKRWGSAALLELATPFQSRHPSGDHNDVGSGDWTVTIPTHLRYLNSTQKDSADEPDQANLEVPWPIVFWACEAEEGLKMSTNPFDRVNLGFDGLFGPKTMFYHVPPTSTASATLEVISVPVLNLENAAWVPFATLTAVAVGFAWVIWQLVRVARTSLAVPSQKRKDQ